MTPSGDAIVEVRGKTRDNAELRQMLEDMGFAVMGCFRLAESSCSAVVNVNDLPNLLSVSEVVSISSNFTQSWRKD